MIEVAAGTVVRTWTGWIRSAGEPAYADYLERTGLAEYRATAGNLGAFAMFEDEGDGRTRVTTVSFWTALEAIRGFAGDDIGRAVFYPEDDAHLIDRELTVRHAVVPS